MRVGDHWVHTAQPAVLEPGAERRPEHGVLAVAQVDTDYRTASLGRDARGDDDRTGHGRVVDPRLDLGRVSDVGQSLRDDIRRWCGPSNDRRVPDRRALVGGVRVVRDRVSSDSSEQQNRRQ